MKLAFMSSVCPKLTLTELLQKAADTGYAGLEFRPEWNHRHGLETDMAPGARRDAAKQLADSGIVACCISPGTKFVSPDEQERNRMLERLKSFVDLARDLGTPWSGISVIRSPTAATGPAPEATPSRRSVSSRPRITPAARASA